MNSLPTDLILQKQPTPITCVQTCLAMALRVPVEKVIERYGDEAMSHQRLIAALTECHFTWNEFVFGPLVVSGWYFLTVPSVNVRGMNHQILLHNDADLGCSGLTILDPSTKETYQADGDDLRSWSHPLLFFPGGILP